MNFRSALPLALSIMLVACGGADHAPETNAAADTEQSSEDAVKVKGKKGRRAYTEEELTEPYSRVSPWRYIVTSPETQYFARMVGKSSVARTVHNSGHALLVPEDGTFTRNTEWKGILDEGQEAALDRFVKAHIVVGIKGPKMLEGAYENLNGDPVVIERNAAGELVCGGARLLGRELETDGGLVIPILGMVEPINWD